MEVAGSRRIPASRGCLQADLNDAGVLRACLPGCNGLNRLSSTQLIASRDMRVGSTNDNALDRVARTDTDPLTGYRLTYDGCCGAAGFGSTRNPRSFAKRCIQGP
jgi:carbon monoxide dehydrogenase subunit G